MVDNNNSNNNVTGEEEEEEEDHRPFKRRRQSGSMTDQPSNKNINPIESSSHASTTTTTTKPTTNRSLREQCHQWIEKIEYHQRTEKRLETSLNLRRSDDDSSAVVAQQLVPPIILFSHDVHREDDDFPLHVTAYAHRIQQQNALLQVLLDKLQMTYGQQKTAVIQLSRHYIQQRENVTVMETTVATYLSLHRQCQQLIEKIEFIQRSLKRLETAMINEAVTVVAPSCSCDDPDDDGPKDCVAALPELPPVLVFPPHSVHGEDTDYPLQVVTFLHTIQDQMIVLDPIRDEMLMVYENQKTLFRALPDRWNSGTESNKNTVKKLMDELMLELDRC